MNGRASSPTSWRSPRASAAAFPLGACLATAEAAKGMTVGTHGSTYGGNPLAMAVGNAAIDIDPGAGFPGACEQDRQLFAPAAGRAGGGPSGRSSTACAGQGLMLGLKMKIPSGEFIAAAREAGLIVLPAGDNVVRLLPPLILTEAEAREGVELLGKAAAALEAAEGSRPMNAPYANNKPRAFSRPVGPRHRHLARHHRRRQGAQGRARGPGPRACPMPTRR